MVDRRFRTLRFISALLKLTALVALAAGVLGALLGAVYAMMGQQSVMQTVCWYPACQALGEPAGSLVAIAAAFLLAWLLFLALFGLGELFSLAVAVEENTRRSALALNLWLTPVDEASSPPAQPPPVQ
jgi:hypothetical protein